MGTNYYLQAAACPHCGVAPDDLHIGKQSAGWPFCLSPRFATWREWQAEIAKPSYVLKDEYGKVIDKQEFFTKVEANKSREITHEQWWGPPSLRRYGIEPPKYDPDGYYFSDVEGFS